jgi:hypothetical protein
MPIVTAYGPETGPPPGYGQMTRPYERKALK